MKRWLTHPLISRNEKWFYFPGVFAIILLGTSMASGIYLAPHIATDQEYPFLKGLHRWSIQFFLFFVALHFVIYLCQGPHRHAREIPWIVGVALGILLCLQVASGIALACYRISTPAHSLYFPFSSFWQCQNHSPFLFYVFYIIHVSALPLFMLILLPIHLTIGKIARFSTCSQQ